MNDDDWQPNTVIYLRHGRFNGHPICHVLKTTDLAQSQRVIYELERQGWRRQIDSFPTVEIARLCWQLQHSKGRELEQWQAKAKAYRDKQARLCVDPQLQYKNQGGE